LRGKSKEERQNIIDAEIEKLKDPRNYREDSLCHYLNLINKKKDGIVDLDILNKLVKDRKIDIKSKNKYEDSALFEVIYLKI
jgi:hypothetical protein